MDDVPVVGGNLRPPRVRPRLVGVEGGGRLRGGPVEPAVLHDVLHGVGFRSRPRAETGSRLGIAENGLVERLLARHGLGAGLVDDARVVGGELLPVEAGGVVHGVLRARGGAWAGWTLRVVEQAVRALDEGVGGVVHAGRPRGHEAGHEGVEVHLVARRHEAVRQGGRHVLRGVVGKM